MNDLDPKEEDGEEMLGNIDELLLETDDAEDVNEEGFDSEAFSSY